MGLINFHDEEMSKDEFISYINKPPYWVKTYEDALRYAEQLQYQLHKAKRANKIYEQMINRFFKLSIIAVDRMYKHYDDIMLDQRGTCFTED